MIYGLGLMATLIVSGVLGFAVVDGPSASVAQVVAVTTLILLVSGLAPDADAVRDQDDNDDSVR